MELFMQSRILIIDDDPAIRKVLCRGLEGEGFETLACENGREAVDLLASGTIDPDCILLDIRMPILTGMEALPLLRQQKPFSPIIMLTAYNELNTGLSALKSGAFDYIVKPARLGAIVEVIGRALKYRTLLIENERLSRKNEEYRLLLEKKVEERTRDLDRALRKLRQMNLETVRVLAETIEAKYVYTRGHCQRVRLLSTGIAQHLGLGPTDIEKLEYAALLHDIGKIGIPETLLHKVMPLDGNERDLINMHPRIGESILRNSEFLIPCLQAVRQHHERWDGTGYPDRLSGDAINPLARIIAVCDSFDAMNSSRPYRKALPLEKSLEEIRKGSGTQFDPSMVTAFFDSGVYSEKIDIPKKPAVAAEFFGQVPEFSCDVPGPRL